MNINASYLELLLHKAKYEQGLGVDLIRIAQTKIGNEKVVLIETRTKKGTDIAPHLHEHGGQICVPLTGGMVRLGKAEKDEAGNYKMDGEKVLIDWDVADQDLQPGKSFEIPEGAAHHFVALDDFPMILLFFLPETHAAASDRLYASYPKGYISKSKK